MKKVKFNYIESKIKEIENDYSNLKLDPYHTKGRQIFVDFLNQFLNMNNLALNGFFLYGTRDWQEESNKFLKDTLYEPLETRIGYFKRIAHFTKERIKQVLRNTEQINQLDDIFDNKLVQFYIDKFSGRSDKEIDQVRQGIVPK